MMKRVTVFRGITGFGKSGNLDSATVTTLFMDVPLVVEFFDYSDNSSIIVKELPKIIEPGHTIDGLLRKMHNLNKVIKC